MKKSIGLVGVIASFLALSANAQETPVDSTKPETATTQTWDPNKNKTVEAITSKYKDKYAATRPAATVSDMYPVLGNYESTVNADAASLTITLDPENKGVVWIEGLPQGKVKAMLRKSPATYKIPAQKSQEGKDVAEGVLIFDKEMKTLNIAIGKEFNAADPASAFLTPEADVTVDVKSDGEKTKVKSKTVKAKNKATAPKAWMYTGTKVEVETVKN
jgi:hypothetical protein